MERPALDRQHQRDKTIVEIATFRVYPIVSCFRHDAGTGENTISLEKCTFREASAAEPIPAAQ